MNAPKYRQEFRSISHEYLNRPYQEIKKISLGGYTYGYLDPTKAANIIEVLEDTSWEVVASTENNVIFRRYVEVT